MHRHKAYLIPAVGAAVVLAGMALLFGVGCDQESQSWPWWTAGDSAAVAAELGQWREMLNANQVLTGDLTCGWNSPLTYGDTTSETGDTVYKFAHLLSVRFEPTDSIHENEYLFGVTADSVAMTDTFCAVTYRDSMGSCLVHFEYDSLWIVGFRPETTVVESLVPPETTIVQRMSYQELRGFDSPQRETKSYGWSAFRKLFLRKDDSAYVLAKTTGFGVYTPTAEDAPSFSSQSGVILSRPGRADTICYTAKPSGRNIYNLVSIDSLYALDVGEEVRLEVTATTPEDSVVDKNRFFVGIEGVKTEITVNARHGDGTISFTQAGRHHIYIEILPLSNLLYPRTGYAGTIWAIPVQVNEP